MLSPPAKLRLAQSVTSIFFGPRHLLLMPAARVPRCNFMAVAPCFLGSAMGF